MSFKHLLWLRISLILIVACLTSIGVAPNVSASGPIVWSADVETGDLSQWRIDNNFSSVEVDTGLCFRPPNGVSTEQAHSGQYSMKLTIYSINMDSGCRQFRKPEPVSGETYYYSAWFYIPQYVEVGTFWNIFQFMAAPEGEPARVYWKLDVRDMPDKRLRIVPIWKGPEPGPHAGDGLDAVQYYQNLTTVPVGEWFHLEAYLKQSGAYDGQIIVWQDGIEILNEQNVKTKQADGFQTWSVNNYGNDVIPAPNSIYIDDAVISTIRIGSIYHSYMPIVLKNAPS
ncbi:MAG: heparin lyase I family protein [Anaerolineales bacterium]|nr:heparin lyase I family protein [Anaerolineales bacterium]